MKLSLLNGLFLYFLFWQIFRSEKSIDSGRFLFLFLFIFAFILCYLEAHWFFSLISLFVFHYRYFRCLIKRSIKSFLLDLFRWLSNNLHFLFPAEKMPSKLRIATTFDENYSWMPGEIPFSWEGRFYSVICYIALSY